MSELLEKEVKSLNKEVAKLKNRIDNLVLGESLLKECVDNVSELSITALNNWIETRLRPGLEVINEGVNTVSAAIVSKILKDIKAVKELDLNIHHVEMSIGPDWTAIAEMLLKEGYTSKPIGLTLEITW